MRGEELRPHVLEGDKHVTRTHGISWAPNAGVESGGWLNAENAWSTRSVSADLPAGADERAPRNGAEALEELHLPVAVWWRDAVEAGAIFRRTLRTLEVKHKREQIGHLLGRDLLFQPFRHE